MHIRNTRLIIMIGSSRAIEGDIDNNGDTLWLQDVENDTDWTAYIC